MYLLDILDILIVNRSQDEEINVKTYEFAVCGAHEP